MLMTLRKLREIIHEEVERCVQWSAGFGGMCGTSSAHTSNETLPPPGLGSETDDGEEEQEGTVHDRS